MSDDVLVKVDNVSKRFCRSLKRSLWYGLQDLGNEIGGRRHGGGSGLPQSSADVQLRPDEFWAVKDVSFELRRGECLGLIGRNGAGKTTLLRMLNGLIKPDTGRIRIQGRVGALIALGAGFNPILSGKENIMINASVLGYSKTRIIDLVDQIVDFAELQDFIEAPVQSYSSGMQVRLGFSIAVHQEPDVLFLDEVLAVGDKAFRVKCLNKILKMKQSCSIIFVSHANEQLGRVCDKGIVLDKGSSFIGLQTIGEALAQYDEISTDSPLQSEIATSEEASLELVKYSKNIDQNDNNLVIPMKCSNWTEQELDLHLVILKKSSHEVVTESYIKHAVPCHTPVRNYAIEFNANNFAEGSYIVSASLCEGVHRHVLTYHRGGTEFKISSKFNRLRGSYSLIQNLHIRFKEYI